MSKRLRFAGTWAAVWAAVVLLHAPLLKLPYYWDEAGYYIPAAFDFFRTGTLIPQSTLSNAHPPLPSLWLALWWHVFGFHPLTTRLAVSAVSALALLAVYRIARAAASRPVALAVAGLTALYPVWFAQSTLAHADIFAAAATLWGLALLVEANRREASPNFAGAAACFCVAALCKETAVVTPVALAAWQIFKALRGVHQEIRGGTSGKPHICWSLPRYLRSGTVTTGTRPDSSSEIQSTCATTPPAPCMRRG